MRDSEFLQLLVARFEVSNTNPTLSASLSSSQSGSTPTRQSPAEQLLATRIRVLELLARWINEFFPGLKHAVDFHQRVKEFLTAADELCVDEQLIESFPVAEFLEFKSMFAQLKVTPYINQPISYPGTVPMWDFHVVDVLTVDADTIAHQLALIDSDLLAASPPLLLFHFHHIDSDDDLRIRTECNSVHALYSRFALVRQWVLTEIVKQRDLGARVEIIERFIRIAIKCEALSDFLSADAIAQGLHSAYVSRLLSTWAVCTQSYFSLMRASVSLILISASLCLSISASLSLSCACSVQTLSRKTSNSFKEFLSAFGNRNNIAEYSKLVEEGRPLVPNMEELANELSSASKQQYVNTSAMVRLARICSHAQKTRYDITPDHELQHALLNLQVWMTLGCECISDSVIRIGWYG
jgi:hypothetical protein